MQRWEENKEARERQDDVSISTFSIQYLSGKCSLLWPVNQLLAERELHENKCECECVCVSSTRSDRRHKRKQIAFSAALLMTFTLMALSRDFYTKPLTNYQPALPQIQQVTLIGITPVTGLQVTTHFQDLGLYNVFLFNFNFLFLEQNNWPSIMLWHGSLRRNFLLLQQKYLPIGLFHSTGVTYSKCPSKPWCHV